ncbi:MAG: ribosome-associated translation inhibitor RaiA [Chitinophagales bacterium]
MNIVIRPVHFDASVQLLDFIKKKLGKLETFSDKIIDAEVYLKLDTNQSIRDKVVEVKLHVPGKTLFGTEVSKTFEESTDLVVENLARQIKKAKDRKNDLQPDIVRKGRQDALHAEEVSMEDDI